MGSTPRFIEQKGALLYETVFRSISGIGLRSEPVGLPGGTGRRQAGDLPLSGGGDCRHGKAGLRRSIDLHLSCLRRRLGSDCLPGTDTAAFLEDALAQLGLTRREANEFIVYWLPQMQENPYNLIAFQSDRYTQAAKLTIDPPPDTLLRVFMAWKPLDKFMEIPAQSLTAPERTGFTAVEWGGCRVR